MLNIPLQKVATLFTLFNCKPDTGALQILEANKFNSKKIKIKIKIHTHPISPLSFQHYFSHSVAFENVSSLIMCRPTLVKRLSCINFKT